MAEKIVEIPGIGVVAFPDGMSDEAIEKAAKDYLADAQKSTRGAVPHGAIGDVLIGAGKGAARKVLALGEAVHTIPGVTTAVDTLYGQPGLSAEAFRQANEVTTARNPMQRVGGAVETAAELAYPAVKGGQLLSTILSGAGTNVAKAATIARTFALPVAKFEATHYVLTKLGMPDSVARIISAGLSGYHRGLPATAEAEAATAATTRAIATAPVETEAAAMKIPPSAPPPQAAPPTLAPSVAPVMASPASGVRPVAPVATPAPPPAAEPPWVQPPPENAQIIRDRLAARRMAQEGPAVAPETPQSSPTAVAPAAPVAPAMTNAERPRMTLSQAQEAVKVAQKTVGTKLRASEAKKAVEYVRLGQDAIRAVRDVAEAVVR